MAFSSEVFVARFTELCNKSGIAPRRALSEIFKMDVSNLVKWRNEESVPKANLIFSIAEYFGVSADYLLGRTDTPFGSDGEISTEEREFIQLLRQADERTKDIAVAAMEAILKTEDKK